MKRLFLLFAFAAVASVANAWERRADEGVVVFATNHMTEGVKAVFTKYLGTDYYGDTHYLYLLEKEKKAKHSKEIHYLHLDSEFKPAKSEGDDALKAIEEALTVVRARNSHSTEEVIAALRTVINLMCDMHDLAKFRIEGIPHSQSDFKFHRRHHDIGKMRDKLVPMKWSSFWLAYSGRHLGFSGAYWAEDMELNLKDRFTAYSKGSLHDWVAENGAKSASYLTKYNPDYVMSLRERNELEDVNYDMMLRAGCRLAALLNEVVK